MPFACSGVSQNFGLIWDPYFLLSKCEDELINREDNLIQSVISHPKAKLEGIEKQQIRQHGHGRNETKYKRPETMENFMK